MFYKITLHNNQGHERQRQMGGHEETGQLNVRRGPGFRRDQRKDLVEEVVNPKGSLAFGKQYCPWFSSCSDHHTWLYEASTLGALMKEIWHYFCKFSVSLKCFQIISFLKSHERGWGWGECRGKNSLLHPFSSSASPRSPPPHTHTLFLSS